LAEVSVVIPALNEAENIAAVVTELPWDLIHECIVVDNGSTDATAAEAKAAGAHVVVLSQRGYGRACAAGAAAANGDILVFMDGDGSDVSAEMDQLLRPILIGDCDFVIGSRMRGKREPGSLLVSQIFAGWLAGLLLRFGFDTPTWGPSARSPGKPSKACT
jgi:glycosyltransferase involved in cell wall biosynthesis